MQHFKPWSENDPQHFRSPPRTLGSHVPRGHFITAEATYSASTFLQEKEEWVLVNN